MKTIPEHTQSTGNVFADLGLPEPEKLLTKSRLALAITRELDKRGLTQQQAAHLLGTTQPVISSLKNGRLSGFTLDRLVDYLEVLEKRVEVRIVPQKSGTKVAAG